MNFVILILIFAIFITMPFIPGIIELLRPTDDKPMFIKMGYSKDARYFGKSFRKILRNSLKKAKFKKNIAEVKLSSGLEKIEVIRFNFNPDKKIFEHILLISGDLIAKNNNIFNKEIYVTGNASFGRNNLIRAALVDKDVELTGNTKIIRWLDVDGNIKTEEGINLGISVSCGKELQLSKDCEFRRLFGNPISTFNNIFSTDYDISRDEKKHTDNHIVLTYFNKIMNEDIVHDKPTTVKGNLITNGNIEIRDEFTINGNIKASGNVIIKTEKKVNITGNVISDNTIIMNGNIEITGNIFSQEEIEIEGVRVGHVGEVKSVIAKKKLTIGNNVTIYGFALTEGIGIVR